MAIAFCSATIEAALSPPPRPPNIVIILADDQGWGDVSVHGNTNLRTPNLDSLARDGALFERFFACSVCAPTRAEFFTGRYHPRGGVRGVSTGLERLNTDEHTIAQTFKASGYVTGAFGKWHNGSQGPYHPNARGFDEYYGFTSGHWGEYFDAPLEHNGEWVRGKGYIADDLTDHALEFITKNQARPFFCYLPFNTPHSPFCVPDTYWDRFKAQPIAMRGKDGDSEDLPVTRCALAMCENIDWNVGRLLRSLDELRLREDTIVVYFSDNGPNSWRWNGGMKGRKGSVDEGGLRVPLFLRYPARIKPGTTVRKIAGAIDLLPTLASLAGIGVGNAKPLDGKDLSPLLLGTAPAWPERMLFSHQNGRISVRTSQYRLDDRGALFDMIADPSQTQDIARQRPEAAAQLREAVTAWRAEVLPPSKQDDRPYPVGYPALALTPLPARDGVPHGNVKRSAPAPNCSFFTNWVSTEDFMTWNIEVLTAGEYEAVIHYTCAETDAGALVQLSFQGSQCSGKVAPAWNPPLLADQDRVPRKGESYLKEFRPLSLGALRLEKGRGSLTLRALKIPGREVMHMRLITLRLKRQA